MSETGRDPFSALLYPMLVEQPPVLAAVVEELAAAPLEKAAEADRLRRRLLEDHEAEILACAGQLGTAFSAGNRLLACGNGGSATSAADLVAALTDPPHPHRPLPAVNLSADAAVITAVANDVSFDDVFARQVIALGRPGDALVAFSTSGNSENLLRALAEARRLGMLTVGISGADGGRMAAANAAGHCFVVRSASVHRIQEVQTTLHHLLVELVRRFTEERLCA